MRYEKPHVALIASAVEAIKGTDKFEDNPDSGTQSTTSAYEADE
jgi:hypothetical protein